jgi:hypothetical protein
VLSRPAAFVVVDRIGLKQWRGSNAVSVATCWVFLLSCRSMQPSLTWLRLSRRCQVSTIVLRSSTSNRLDDLQRAIEDGVNNYKQVCTPAAVFRPGV